MTSWALWILRRRRFTVAVLALLLCAASGVALRSGDQLRYADEREYQRLAAGLLAGEGYVDAQGHPTAQWPPGYPVFLAGVYRVWDRPVAAKLANALALTAAAALLSLLAASAAPHGRAVAPLLVLLYPMFLYTASTLYPQTLGTLLLAASLYAMTAFRRWRPAAAVSGILWGILSLTIPAFLMLLPIAAGFLLWRKGETRRESVRGAAVFVLAALLVVGPWTLRNAMIFRTFVPVSTNSGINLLLGNSENTEPDSGVNVDVSHYLEKTRGMNEAETDAHLARCAAAWVASHPARAAALYGRKVLNYFHFRNRLGTRTEASPARDAIVFLTYYPLLLLAVARWILPPRPRFPATETLLYVLYFGNAFLSAIFFTRLRFRIPFDALLIAIVAIFIGDRLRRIAGREQEERDRTRASPLA